MAKTRLRRVRPGQPISAEQWNAMVDAIEAIGVIEATPPLEIKRFASGLRTLSLGIPTILPRLARTVSTGTYPTRADAYTAWEIEFVDATFDEAAGPGTLTITARDHATPYQIAHNIYNDPFVPEGTLLEVWRDNNRWWFEYEDEIQIAVLQGTLSEGGSVSVKVQLPGGGDAPGGAVLAWDKLGVMTGASLHKAYIKWQREHAQYWIVNKECDASVPSVTFTPIPEVSRIHTYGLDRYAQGSVVMGSN